MSVVTTTTLSHVANNLPWDYTESYACGVQIRPHSEARETEAGITEEGPCAKRSTRALAVVSDHEINEQMEKGHFEISPVDPKSKLTITWGNLKVQQQ